ncbi:MAG: DHH family phosphoesterase [Christensenellales bacterium]|jgi:phosphoesterase RecJ-like protein
MEKIIELLKNANSVAIFSHMSADPDAWGSVGAMKHALEEMGKQTACFLNEEVPEKFAFLGLGNVYLQPIDKHFDLALSLDVSTSDRLGVHKDYFLSHKNQIAIDHHSSRTPFANVEFVRFESANCEILLDLILQLKGEVSQKAANCLYFGLLGDTGGFANNGTTAKSFEAAAKLFNFGAQTTLISNILFKTKTLNELKMQERMISRIEIYDNVAISYITEKDKKELDMLTGKAGDLVSILKSIKGISVAAMIKQKKGKNYEISLRSDAGIDVSAVAEKFGGGGHKQAAGLGLVGSLKQVKTILLKELKQLGK